MRNRALVTVVGPDRALDLELPTDYTIGELLPFLCELCAAPASRLTGGAREGDGEARAEEEWLLFIEGSPDPLASGQTLSEAEVYDGRRLLLQALPSNSDQVAAADTQELFLPSSVAPSERTGGIGVTWEQLPLS
ncbi:EsaB/YukD family protein [Thermogemmatispora carboxidivorans]|uniref:EsaB/YukD family protein n=1 Tax=Thermogemmatispora carboxidivorans TaxID=1382306 RepID=UPI00069BC431|nr:EsaB/YukD family protein [Thermogemmatispora carboxidivorans]